MHTAVIIAAAVILIITGGAKCMGALRDEQSQPRKVEPVFGVSLQIFWIVTGTLEIAMAIWIFLHRRSQLATIGLAVITADFLLYRILLKIYKPSVATCSCLGNLGGLLGLPDHVVDQVSIVLLGFFCVATGLSIYVEICKSRAANLF